MTNQLIGIDEAGRGALAGALFMGACLLKKELCGLNDSKKLSEIKREQIYKNIVKNSHFLILSFSCDQIDKNGLSWCLTTGLKVIKMHFSFLKNVNFLYDGNTNFGVKDVKTLIKADETIPQVSAASILAKVSRDENMKNLALKYPNYNFEKHKGYGTKEHIELIRNFGYSKIHRKSFHLKDLEKGLFD